MFPYRWLPRTIIPNLTHAYYEIIYGIKNLFIYFTIIWIQRDWDWEYLARIMEFKFRRMAANFEKYGSAREAKNLLICATLLKRMIEDYPSKSNKEDQKYLGKLIGKHFMSWWN